MANQIVPVTGALGSLNSTVVLPMAESGGPKLCNVLRGINSVFAVNISATLAGMLFDCDVEWTEE